MDTYKFEVSLVYVLSFRTARATLKPYLKKKTKPKTKNNKKKNIQRKDFIVGAETVAWWLRKLAAPVEHMGFILRTSVVAQSTLSSSVGIWYLCMTSRGIRNTPCGVNAYM